MRGPRLNVPEVDEGVRRRALQAYADGVSEGDIAKRFRVCFSRVRQWAIEAGVERGGVYLGMRRRRKSATKR